MPRARTAAKSSGLSTAQLERRLKVIRRWMELEDLISERGAERESAVARRRQALKDRARDAEWDCELDEILSE
jgi:hypothetical protein